MIKKTILASLFFLNSISLAMEVSLNQARFDKSQIKELREYVSENYVRYHALLKDGSDIHCEHYLTGPNKGRIDCTKITEGPYGLELPIPSNTFYLLKNLFEESQKK